MMTEEVQEKIRGSKENELKDPKSAVIPFGKFKGIPVSEVPEWYLQWFLVSVEHSCDVRWAIRQMLNLPKLTEEDFKKFAALNPSFPIDTAWDNYVKNWYFYPELLEPEDFSVKLKKKGFFKPK